MHKSVPMEHLLPRGLAAEAGAPLARFIANHALPFLLVRLDDPSGKLMAGLTLSTEQDASTATADGIGYHTLQHENAEVERQVQHASSLLDRYVERVARMPHFAVPLRKRKQGEAAYIDRISVGRARNQDVVLRHASVSKFHAWFELRDGVVKLADGGSSNGTRLDGELLAPRELFEVQLGSDIGFGSVEAMLCSPEDLWGLAQCLGSSASPS